MLKIRVLYVIIILSVICFSYALRDRVTSNKIVQEGEQYLEHFWKDPKQKLRQLYIKYSHDLIKTRNQIKKYCKSIDLHAGGGDIELELIYLRIRDQSPEKVLEIGWGQGMTSLYILAALNDNNYGHLWSVDPLPSEFQHERKVQTLQYLGDQSSRWTLVEDTLENWWPSNNHHFNYIHSDGLHTTSFAKFVTEKVMNNQNGKLCVSIHDVFVSTGIVKRDKKGLSHEGQVFLNWFKSKEGTGYAIALSHFPKTYSSILKIRKYVGLDEEWIATKKTALNNPTLFFDLKLNL